MQLQPLQLQPPPPPPSPMLSQLVVGPLPDITVHLCTWSTFATPLHQPVHTCFSSLRFWRLQLCTLEDLRFLRIATQPAFLEHAPAVVFQPSTRMPIVV